MSSQVKVEAYPATLHSTIATLTWSTSPHHYRPLNPVAAEVDAVGSVNIFAAITVVAWRSDCGLGSELGVIGDLRSIASM